MNVQVARRTLSVDTAAVLTASWLGTGLVLTASLKHHGRREISEVLRNPIGRGVVVLFLLHLNRWLGPLDPFCALGRCVPVRLR